MSVSIRKLTQRRFRADAKATLAVAAVVGLLAAPSSEAAGSDEARGGEPVNRWTRTLAVDVSAHELGLPAGAPPQRLARSALRSAAGRLGLSGSISSLRLDRRQRTPAADGGRPLEQLRFQQTAGALRVVWSQIDVTVVARRVSSISATVVPVRSGKPAGERRVSRKQALGIALRAVPGAEEALRPLPAAYAGSPTTERRVDGERPRRVWVVEVQPPAAGEEAPAGLCIAVDAGSGKVIGRWPGMADRPDRGPNARGTDIGPPPSVAARDARDNAAYMLMTRDGTGQVDPEPGPLAPYAVFVTPDDPRTSVWPSYLASRVAGVQPTAAMDAVSANAANVARTICVVRGWCGREGGFQPDATVVLPWLVIGNTTGTSHAERDSLDVALDEDSVMLGNGDPNVPANDIVAHEFGHVMDWVYAGDRFVGGFNTQGFEVEEALADMFAYEYDRADALIGEDAGSPAINMADPGAIEFAFQPYPAHYDDYDSTPPLGDHHFNGTILSHAYYLFVQAVGHDKAGRVLHNVPSFLSPQPTFEQVARGFYMRAQEIYGGDVADAARSAFEQVGVKPLIICCKHFP